MALSRSELLKELLPGLNTLFGTEYSREIGNIAWREIVDSYCSDDPYCSERLVEIISWDGKKWVTISEPMSREEAESLLKVSE